MRRGRKGCGDHGCNFQDDAFEVASIFVKVSFIVGWTGAIFGQNCSQYNTGDDPAKSYNLQACCSSGFNGGFALSDSYCKANPSYFVYNNNVSCGNNCVPPSVAAYQGASIGVVPAIGWQRGTGAINVCLDAAFSTSAATSLRTGIQNAFGAEGLTTNFIGNKTDSRCSQSNSYTVVDNSASNSGMDGFTTFPVTKWNSNNTELYTSEANTVIYMGNNPTAAQLQFVGTHEALHTDGVGDDYAPGCGTGQTYMWFQVPSTPSNPAVPSIDTCADGATIHRTASKQSGGPPVPPSLPVTPPPENNCTGGFYCPNSSIVCGPGGWYCLNGESGCSGSQPNCGAGTVPECTDGEWSCTSGCVDPEPEPCCDDCHETCENNEWVCIGSPIVLDVFGKGFHFSDLPHGVKFRVLPSQVSHQMTWPEAEFRNGWLALDRNGDGRITDFTELFGNATPQPKSPDPNGYLALAVFDSSSNGGNGNGLIDIGDSVFSHLLVWIDDNHNGISEPDELHTLQEVGIFRIDLHYFYSPYVDENGNQFRYRSRVRDEAGAEHETCYDVFVKISN